MSKRKSNKQVKAMLVYIADELPRIKFNRPFRLHCEWSDKNLIAYNTYEHPSSTYEFDIKLGTVSIKANR